jgi:hypothetical protein
MSPFDKISRYLSPSIHIRIKKSQIRRELQRKTLVSMPIVERRAVQERLINDLYEYDMWQLEIDDQAIVVHAKKIGIDLDEVEFTAIDDDRNYGRYYCVGPFGHQHLRDEFRKPLKRMLREHEPIYRKERRENVELCFKLITVLTTAATGVIGALIGLLAMK